MAQIHFGVMYDTETATFTEVDMQSMPVDSDEYVFAHDEWRHPTEAEMDLSVIGSVALGLALSTIPQIAEPDPEPDWDESRHCYECGLDFDYQFDNLCNDCTAKTDEETR